MPEPNALPDDTYSLDVTIDGETMVLAQDVQIQDIPNEPYVFESKLNRCDFDTDGAVDFLDFAAFASHWKQSDCNYPGWCARRDLNYDHVVDFNDLRLFRDNWLWETIAGDFNINGRLEFNDFAILASAWLTEAGQGKYNPKCDVGIPADNFIDWLDLEVLAENWLNGGSP